MCFLEWKSPQQIQQVSSVSPSDTLGYIQYACIFRWMKNVPLSALLTQFLLVCVSFCKFSFRETSPIKSFNYTVVQRKVEKILTKKWFAVYLLVFMLKWSCFLFLSGCCHFKIYMYCNSVTIASLGVLQWRGKRCQGAWHLRSCSRWRRRWLWRWLRGKTLFLTFMNWWWTVYTCNITCYLEIPVLGSDNLFLFIRGKTTPV